MSNSISQSPASRVERSAPRRVRPLGLRLPSKRTSPFFGGYPSSNRTTCVAAHPFVGQDSRTSVAHPLARRPLATSLREATCGRVIASGCLRQCTLRSEASAVHDATSPSSNRLVPRTRLRALRVAFGKVPSEASPLRCM